MTETTHALNMKNTDITGPQALKLRLDRNMTQPEFWTPLGVGQSSASKYESGASRLPRSVAILIATTYLGAGKPQQSPRANAISKAKRALDKAEQTINRAREALDSI